MASLAESWAQSQLKPQEYDTSNAEVAPVLLPGSGTNMDQVLYGQFSGIPGAKEQINASLQQVAQQAGLPANFDWTPYLAQAAKQHYDQFGTTYSMEHTNFAVPVRDAVQVAAAQNPSLAGMVPQLSEGSEFWNQGEQQRKVVTESLSKNRSKTNKMELVQLALVAAGFGGMAAFGGAAGASGGAGPAGFGEAGYAGGAGAGGGAGAATAGYQPSNYPSGAEGEFGIGNYDANALALEAGDYGGLGGAASTSGSGGTAAGGAAGSTALSRILDGTGGKADYLSVLGNLGMTAYSAYASDKQTDAYKEQAAKYEAMGAPYRDQLTAISADPNQFYNSPAAQQSLEAVLRKLSVNGNPAGSPYAQSLAVGALYDKYNSERALLGNLGGLSAYNSAAPTTATNAIGSQANTYNAIGYGAGQLFNPPQGLEDILKQYKIAY